MGNTKYLGTVTVIFSKTMRFSNNIIYFEKWLLSVSVMLAGNVERHCNDGFNIIIVQYYIEVPTNFWKSYLAYTLLWFSKYILRVIL